MDQIILLSEVQARQLMLEMMHVDSKGNYGLRSLRVSIDGDQVKFKVNEWGWSPPMGKLDPDCREAARRRVEQNLEGIYVEDDYLG